MKKAKKVLLMVLCAVLLVSATVAGTAAYLTSTQTVTNTFTVGNIVIKLDEAKVGANGKKITPEVRSAEGNAYKLVPGLEYDKDPTVWVKEGSEEAYIRMLVTVNNYGNMKNAFAYDENYIVISANGVTISGSMIVLDKLVDRNSGAWQCVKFTEDTTANTGTYEFRYFPGAYTATADDNDNVEEYDELPALFTTITVPEEIDGTHLAYLNSTTIEVAAQAIQTAGFENVDAAWNAFPAN